MGKTAILVGDRFWQGGDQFWLPKLVRPNRFWQQKLVRGTNFGGFFCQNWSGRTDFRGNRFWCDRFIHCAMVFLFIRRSYPFSSTTLQKSENLTKEVSIVCSGFWLRHTNTAAYTRDHIIMKHVPIYNRHDVFTRMLLYIVSFEIARLHVWTNRFRMFFDCNFR